MLGISNETSLFEYRLKQVAYGLLKIPETELYEMTPNQILDQWSAYIYAETHSGEAERINRLIMAITLTAPGEEEQKKGLMNSLLFEDPALQANRIFDEIEAIKNIKAPEKVEING